MFKYPTYFFANFSFLTEFTIEGVLGWGFYGVVFKAQNRLDDGMYAVKRIPVKGM